MNWHYGLIFNVGTRRPRNTCMGRNVAAIALALSIASHPLLAESSEPIGWGTVTAVGQARTVNFTDGSVAFLSARSEIKIDYTESQRLVQLVRGRVTFEVEPAVAKPFVVATPLINVTAVATRFTVVRSPSDGAVTVEVHDGVVNVAGPALAASVTSMPKGQTLRVTPKDLAIKR